ncbi:L-rhamnose isomerase / sugar isomerase [Pseudooceanicola antarcticus]|uniref:L-rhamnose catabolism isomerase n=1 Tax=Pseudooceanicola antarcticus TaxID=1247613 RepID=A0A285HXB3_9RHOB|nr:L-rhamnose catabolism isomerase [Pseudooceanicola antarcticus]PJE30419.1 L-rhamnose catabolism isomerase [Pseudooceanicola antarcticus]SNY40283.1 L-rhamnose isomerase / sugar isomerase [Pseudooceanicola antarcticus]
MITKDIIEARNAPRAADLEADYAALGARLARNGIAIDDLLARAKAFEVAVPSWGTGTGGTRFARFPGGGEPANIFDKLDDCGVIHGLTQATPRVSLHIPWDKAAPADLLAKAEEHGLGFDAMNSNTFQDQPDQAHSYKFGSLSHVDAATRAQAIEHNLECIEIGKTIGSKALTVWIGDGANFPGQTHMGRQFDRYLSSMKEIYAGLPEDWRIFSEHKIYEPAFYSTVVQDWGTSLLTAQELGEKAMCLVDLGHHAPNVNIEMIVSRLIRAGKLGGFHFNDSKYGDDDLDSGTIEPYRLFLVWNELVDAEATPGLDLAHMIDQSHNVTDPIESLMISAMEIQRAFVQASLVDRVALAGYQEENDALMASATLRAAFRTDVEPILAMARMQTGGAIDPIATYRASGYRAAVSETRPVVKGAGGGIV